MRKLHVRAVKEHARALQDHQENQKGARKSDKRRPATSPAVAWLAGGMQAVRLAPPASRGTIAKAAGKTASGKQISVPTDSEFLLVIHVLARKRSTQKLANAQPATYPERREKESSSSGGPLPPPSSGSQFLSAFGRRRAIRCAFRKSAQRIQSDSSTFIMKS